jgi:hypothetical protein
MNIQVSKEWANAITVEHRGMRRALEEIVELTKGSRDRRMRAIYEIASVAIATHLNRDWPLPRKKD